MKTRKALSMWRFGLIVTILCICSIPHLAAAAAPVSQIPTGPRDINGNWATPDYYTTANWANSPPLAKFVDTLPGLTPANANSLGQYLSVGKPDIVTYPGSDYYEIDLVEYRQRMHSDLPATTGPTTGGMTGTLLRGYVQVNKGTDTSTCGATPLPVCTTVHNTLTPDPVHYLGPNIVALRDRPVRIKFTNRLPTGVAGDLFIPVDTSVMGAGVGPADASGAPCDSTVEPNACASYTQNRSDIHLHGGRTPWISDGTPHQWIVPAGEVTPFTKGVSLQNVPDMPDPGPGSTTYYYSNQQSARLLFYHEHAWGITRLNPYVGVAAGYIITDKWEQDLIERKIIPPFLDQIPLVIQDRTFVDASPTTHPVTGEATTMVRLTDPLWNWGSAAPDANGIRPPTTGDLWTPHVYMPAQTQVAGAGGTNPFGRWMYGPWFYPATVISKGPVANPYYDPNCSSTNPFELADCQTPGQPTQIPGTPNVSMGMEAFQDSAVVNGTAFPTLTVDPRAYRFRMLNAANDRFWNLSFYKADPNRASTAPYFDPASPKYRPGLSNLTEVKMVPASASLARDNNWPPLWPVDGRDGGVPDPGTCTGTGATRSCTNFGPSFLQIGTEGGFLPQPVEIVQQPITYNIDPTAFWVGNVNKMGLALGPAERADVIVDFSPFAGQTLILYNDAPAAWPAGVVTYDYYTDAPDLRDIGGYGTGGEFNPAYGIWENGTGPKAGYAPNIRTVMQVIVRPTVTGTPYNFNRAALEAEFTAAAPVSTVNPAPTKTLFERSQEPIIVGQAAYSTTYPNSYFPTNFPWEGIAQINDQSLNFVTLAGQQVNVPTEPKGLHDEMGASFDPVYGRMSGNLGMQLPNPTSLTALLVLYGFSDVPTEHINNSTSVNVEVLPGLPGQPGIVADGTQIWKISHNGVDTHPIHFHIFDVQLINRVGWDGQILLPEPNELGWKDTVKISPLEDTIVAVRPRAPSLPFGIPNSLRPLNPAIPIDSVMGFVAPTPGSTWPIPMNNGTIGSGFSNIDWHTGGPYVYTNPPPYPYPNYKGVVTNVLYDFGWEYVWHCHILSHEEMDMMRPIVLNYAALLPPAFTATATVSGSDVVLNWNDPTPVVYTDLNTYGDPANEIGFNVYRTTLGVFPKDLAGNPKPLNPAILRANSTSYTDTGATGSETYIVEAFNAKGSTVSIVGSLFTATVATTNGPTFTSPGPVNLQANISGVPTGLTVTQVAFYDGATLIGTVIPAPGPYTLAWNNVTVGTHTITAKVSTNFPSIVVTSAPFDVVVGGTLAADFTPADGSIFGVCDNITFTSTSTGTIAGYSWLVDTTVIPFPTNSLTIRLSKGTHSVTLGINNLSGETAQITKSVTVISHLPTAVTGGPYTVIPGGSLVLNGSGTNVLDPCSTMVAYGWDIDNKVGYEFTTPNPTISYNALISVLGAGTHTMTFMVTDSNGNVATATTTVTVVAPDIRIRNNTSGNYSYYPNLQAAYTAAGNNTVVELTAGAVTGGLVTNRNITVTLSGGFDTAFSAVTGVTTIRNTVTLKQGKVIMRNIRALSPYPAFTTASPLPGYTIGTGAYSAAITASGGIPAYSYAITAGALPTELTLATDGQITGTPTTPGTYHFTVKVTDSAVPSSWSNSQAYQLVVVQPATLAITTAALPDSTTNSPYSRTIAASGGVPPYTNFAVTAGALPDGLLLNASTGEISGTPTTAGGPANFTITVTDSTLPSSATASQALSLTVQPALAITTLTLPNATANSTYSQPVVASGGVTPYTLYAVTVGVLPDGLAINPSTGVISGTPTTAGGPTSFTVTVTDSTTPAATASQALLLTVQPALAITTLALPNATANSPYIQSVVASGGVTPYTLYAITVGVLPDGLAINPSTGVISGTPTTAGGPTSFTVTVTDSTTPAATASQTLSLTVQPALAITTLALPNATANSPYSQTVVATGGVTPYTLYAVTVGVLPDGLAINPGTGVISGTPTTLGGPTNFTVTVTDSTTPAATASQALTLTVQPALAITTLTLPDATANSPFSQTVVATGGVTPYTNFAVTVGVLPDGLAINPSTGVISGTPSTAGGPTGFTVTVTDSTTPAATASQALTLTVQPALAITTVALPDATANSPYSQTVTASGGVTPYTNFSVTVGALPDGLVIDPVTGIISGTPTTVGGPTNFTVTVTDSTTPAATASQALTLTVL